MSVSKISFRFLICLTQTMQKACNAFCGVLDFKGLSYKYTNFFSCEIYILLQAVVKIGKLVFGKLSGPSSVMILNNPR